MVLIPSGKTPGREPRSRSVTLDETLAQAWRLLAEGAADPASPFHRPTLATVALDGSADARTLVLRSCDPAARRITLHTDVRADKYAQIQANPRVGVHVWDSGIRLQVRLHGRATLHCGDALARAAWLALPARSRQLYRVRQTPGSELADPSPAAFSEVPEAAGFAVFAVVAVAVERLETLTLHAHGQYRARFDWPQGEPVGRWLVP